MGGRADQLLAQRLRPTPSLHRTPPGLRRRLPRPGRRHRHHPCTAAGRMVLLPLGHPAKITAHPLTYWRTLLMVHPRSGTGPSQRVSGRELYVHPRLRVAGPAAQRAGGRRRAAAVVLLCGLVGVAPAGAAVAATAGAGTVVGWGSNSSGQASPPAGLAGVTAIAAGNYHSLALKSDGTVVGWGGDGYGETRPPAGLTGGTAIAAGGSHSLAMKGDGTVVGWGLGGVVGGRDREWFQIRPPAGLTGVTAIAAGNYHSLALKSDGTVVAWGANWAGQVRPPAGLTGVTAIAAGSNHSLALKSDGTVIAWGVNGWGQTDVPAGLSGVVAIAAGTDHSLALQGPRYAWAGFSSPVANPPAVNPVTAGRAIPVTFSLGGDQGLDIFRTGYPASAAYPCGGSTPADATEPTVTAGASGLSYDPATDRYTYAWKTDKAWPAPAGPSSSGSPTEARPRRPPSGSPDRHSPSHLAGASAQGHRAPDQTSPP